MDLSPGLRVVGSHERLPGGRCREGVMEGGIARIAEPCAPHAAGLQLQSQLVAASVVPQQSHCSIEIGVETVRIRVFGFIKGRSVQSGSEFFQMLLSIFINLIFEIDVFCCGKEIINI